MGRLIEKAHLCEKATNRSYQMCLPISDVPTAPDKIISYLESTRVQTCNDITPTSCLHHLKPLTQD